MQATVASYDENTRAGTLVDDHGATWAFEPDALAEHIRHLRAGQRVHVDATERRVTGVRLW